MEIFISVLFFILLSVAFMGVMFFFTDDSCLPHKRKMENMLDTIMAYQKKYNFTNGVRMNYKEKSFLVSVKYTSINYYYGQYTVYINGNLVKTFHILKHLYSKSRSEQHHGDMRESEEYEIIQAVYKSIEKANKKSFDEEWDKTSYFN